METLRQYLARIQAQLAGLTISQKLLIGLLVVVMVGTIFFMVLWSAKPEMVVLIPQSMSPEEINRAEMFLKSSKYDFQTSGDKILVPAEKAYAIRGEMFAAQALPKDTTAALAKLIESNNFLIPDATQARQWTFATQETLTKMLRYFPYIEDGNVLIARGEKSTLGRAAVPSTATVTVKVRGNEPLSTSQVVAIVDMVRGAVAGLSREDVHVTDGQRSYQVPSSDTQMPSDLLAFKKAYEEELIRKLYTMFSNIPTVKIAVNAVPDMRIQKISAQTYDPKPVKATAKETNQETSTADGSGSGGEPGVKPNVGASVDSSSSRRSTSSTSNNSTTENIVKIGDTKTDILVQAGTEWKDTTASISLPRSYFVDLYRRMKHDTTADPEESDKDFALIMDKQIQMAKARAANAIGVSEESKILVDWFDDTITLRPTGPLTPPTAINMTTMISQYAKQGVLALVALGALGMMLMMVRRAVPADADADVNPSVFFGGAANGRRKGEPGQLDVTEDVIGEANEGDAVLTGIELDDETLQSRKLVDEVSTMIKENPENAASLVKRWLAKSA
ncbi:MAG: hypothetical protein FWD61_12805 [Phycisphaerales bacterium]|nr:hypothetical protein [Phycisphaerales bacterium]